ncbi:MAG: hypothetical protein AB1490_10575 [Pseudomonadota bacterium]
MRQLWLGLLAAIGIFIGVTDTRAQSCTDYLQRQLLTMDSNASSCGASAQMMRTAPNLNNPTSLRCGEPLSARSNQWTQLEQCARVYACASMTYRCALNANPGGPANGSACSSAMSSCLARIGVPR